MQVYQPKIDSVPKAISCDTADSFEYRKQKLLVELLVVCRPIDRCLPLSRSEVCPEFPEKSNKCAVKVKKYEEKVQNILCLKGMYFKNATISAIRLSCT